MACNLKTMKLLDCVLIGVYVLTGSNMVCTRDVRNELLIVL